MRPALLVVLAALMVVPAALAHGGGGNRGYTSTVTGLEPRVAGIEITVLDGDDRLRLENQSGKEIVIEGYDGEPYLRFADDGVYQNTRSPAVYLNEERFGGVELPANANAKASPAWKKVASSGSYEWHDHRAHWMSPIPPPKIKAAPDQPHHIFDWKVSAKADGAPFVIAGSLGYGPLPGQKTNWGLVVGSGMVLAMAVAGPLAARLRRDRQRQ